MLTATFFIAWGAVAAAEKSSPAGGLRANVNPQ
jgi:hypothetical protein